MRFLILWWWMVGNAPRGQPSAWSVVKFSLKAHLEGIRYDSQLYLRLSVSRNSILGREILCSSRGDVISQLEDPLSWASSAALNRWWADWGLWPLHLSFFLLSFLPFWLLSLIDLPRFSNSVIIQCGLLAQDETDDGAADVLGGLEVGWWWSED